MTNTVKWLLIHGTDYSYRALYDQRTACEGWHKDRDFPISSLGSQIGYHHLFTGGKAYRCKADTDQGAHCNTVVNGISLNFQSLGYAVGFDGDIELMPAIEYGLLQRQVWADQDKYGIPNNRVLFHRDFTSTSAGNKKTCPGSLITNAWLNTFLTRPSAVIPPLKAEENTCIAQEKEIVHLKEVVTWYETLVQKFYNIFSKR